MSINARRFETAPEEGASSARAENIPLKSDHHPFALRSRLSFGGVSKGVLSRKSTVSKCGPLPKEAYAANADKDKDRMG